MLITVSWNIVGFFLLKGNFNGEMAKKNPDSKSQGSIITLHVIIKISHLCFQPKCDQILILTYM